MCLYSVKEVCIMKDMKNKNLNKISATGFKTPDHYFESLDQAILSKLHSDTPLNAIKRPGFKVPDHYFNTFEDHITQNISKQNKTKVIQLNTKRTLLYVSSIAAAILLLITLFVIDDTPSFDNLETETVENYLLDENISSYEIAALLNDEELDDLIFSEHNLDKDNIEEYLLNNADIEALMIE